MTGRDALAKELFAFRYAASEWTKAANWERETYRDRADKIIASPWLAARDKKVRDTVLEQAAKIGDMRLHFDASGATRDAIEAYAATIRHMKNCSPEQDAESLS